MVLQALMQDIKLGLGRGEGAVLHRSQCVAVTGAYGPLWKLKERNHRIATCVEEVVAQVFEGRISAIAGPDAETVLRDSLATLKK